MDTLIPGFWEETLRWNPYRPQGEGRKLYTDSTFKSAAMQHTGPQCWPLKNSLDKSCVVVTGRRWMRENSKSNVTQTLDNEGRCGLLLDREEWLNEVHSFSSLWRRKNRWKNWSGKWNDIGSFQLCRKFQDAEKLGDCSVWKVLMQATVPAVHTAACISLEQWWGNATDSISPLPVWRTSFRRTIRALEVKLQRAWTA